MEQTTSLHFEQSTTRRAQGGILTSSAAFIPLSE